MFKSKKVFAFNVPDSSLKIFKSQSHVSHHIPGIEIAEGDWLFFASDGSPLEAKFSSPAQIFPEKSTYSDGIYTLVPKNQN